MTFKQLQDEVIALRFNEGKRASVKSWLNLGYQHLWAGRLTIAGQIVQADWTFKTTSSALAVISGDNSPAMPADFAKALALYDNFGDELEYLPRAQWERRYLPLAAGGVEAWTVVDRQIYLAPTPQVTGNYSLSYRRRLSHVDPVSGVIGGIMVEDGDQTLWPAEHDYALVLDAVLLGQELEGDPNEGALARARDEALLAMVDDLAGSGVAGQPTFWGVAS